MVSATKALLDLYPTCSVVWIRVNTDRPSKRYTDGDMDYASRVVLTLSKMENSLKSEASVADSFRVCFVDMPLNRIQPGISSPDCEDDVWISFADFIQ